MNREMTRGMLRRSMVTLGVSVAAAALIPAAAHAGGLQPGQRLNAGETRSSANGRVLLAMQRDGNLVLYRGRRALWSSQTKGHRSHAIMQRDGNLVVYSRAHKPQYASGTKGHGFRLVVTNSGSAVIRDGGRVRWSSRSDVSQLGPNQVLRPNQLRRSPNHRYLLAMQKDGNLVLYRDRGLALWSSQTHGFRGAYALMQADGNLVVYSRGRVARYSTGTQVRGGARLSVGNRGAVKVIGAGATLWTSKRDITQLGNDQSLRPNQLRTSPDGKYLLVMQPDGNLVLYKNPGLALWSSQTGGHPGAFATLQRDGNLVVYSSTGAILYASASHGDPTSVLDVEPGRVVIRTASKEIWTSDVDNVQLSNSQRLFAGQFRRSPSGRYVLGMQPDGNLVLTDQATHRVLWHSSSGGHPGAYALMGADGNFVVRTAQTSLFQTGTKADAATRVLVADDGSFLVVSGPGHGLWSSRFGPLG